MDTTTTSSKPISENGNVGQNDANLLTDTLIAETVLKIEGGTLNAFMIRPKGGSMFLWIGHGQAPEINDLSLAVANLSISSMGNQESLSKYFSIHLSEMNGGKPVYASVNEQLGFSISEHRSEIIEKIRAFLKKNLEQSDDREKCP